MKEGCCKGVLAIRVGRRVVLGWVVSVVTTSGLNGLLAVRFSSRFGSFSIFVMVTVLWGIVCWLGVDKIYLRYKLIFSCAGESFMGGWMGKGSRYHFKII